MDEEDSIARSVEARDSILSRRGGWVTWNVWYASIAPPRMNVCLEVVFLPKVDCKQRQES